MKRSADNRNGRNRLERPSADFVRRNDVTDWTQSRSARRCRLKPVPSGFTLFEMVMVVAVLAAIAAIAWTGISAMQNESRLRQGGFLVQSKLASARVHAIDTGYEYQFCYEPGGQRFVIVPHDPHALAIVAGSGVKVPFRAAGKLPSDKVHFQSSGSTPGVNSLPPEALAGLPNAAEYSGVNWSRPVLFHPNGSAAGGTVHIVNQDKKHPLEVTITVRGLTGSVSTSKIHAEGK